LSARSGVHFLAQELRDFINRRRVHFALLKDKRRFYQLCTCLDLIEDCELAIGAYVSPSVSRDPDPDKGATYLALFGLLQAFFVQQDAVENLAEALGVPSIYKQHPDLRRVRDVRNKTSGHPTKRSRKGQGPSFHALNRSMLGTTSFQLVSISAGGTQVFETYRVADLISDQNDGISGALKGLLDLTRERDRLHREEFRADRLEATLGERVGYLLEKLGEGLSPMSPSGGPLARISVDGLGKALDDFQAALGRRGLSVETYDSIRDAYPKLRYALAQLQAYFDSQAGRIFGLRRSPKWSSSTCATRSVLSGKWRLRSTRITIRRASLRSSPFARVRRHPSRRASVWASGPFWAAKECKK
jgi:hypothetical protein